MTNKEKAKILVGYEIDTPRSLMKLEARDEYDNLISMAEWKDREFREYLEKKIKNFPFLDNQMNLIYYKTIKQIINELFKD